MTVVILQKVKDRQALFRRYVEIGMRLYCYGRHEPELIRAELELRAQDMSDAELAHQIAAGREQLAL